MHFSRARKVGSDGCSHICEDMWSFLGKPLKPLYFTQIPFYVPKYHHFSPDTTVIFQKPIVFAHKCPPNATGIAPNTLKSPKKCTFLTQTRGSENALFSRLVQCTFLQLGQKCIWLWQLAWKLALFWKHLHLRPYPGLLKTLSKCPMTIFNWFIFLLWYPGVISSLILL